MVTMVIQSEPVPGQDVVVSVNVLGEVSHVAMEDDQELLVDRPNRRPLTGTERAAVATLMNTTGLKGTVLYYKKLAEIKPDECKAGNTTACQNAGVFRQAAYEQRIGARIDKNVFMELEIQKDAWKASLPGSKIDGFIQSIGTYPFVVTFYLEGQLKVFLEKCKSGDDCVLHFDATGSVV
jgi:hypothetical protein